MPDSESTSIREKETEKITFRLFPNPVRDILYIESGEKMLKIEVFNSSGYQVQYLDAKDRYSVPVDVSNLHPGLYVVRCTMQGQQTITARFVVEK